ncbi:MAG: hypothetical protein AB1486_04985 [Planctomycetota bacterium]
MTMRRGHQRKTRDLDPDAVASGRLDATIEELFGLIRRVNPTSSSLQGSAREQAYALKSRLQSLLIERFGDALEVEPSTDSAGEIVGLRHRLNRRDACHVRLIDLSPAARAWVRARQYRPDEGSSPPPPPGTLLAGRAAGLRGSQSPHAGAGDRAGDPEGLLRRGQAALEDYDFELAQECFEQAVKGAAGSRHETMLRAAQALLALHVDHLAQNEEALALRDRLPPEVLEDAGVRCLLALAAARGAHGAVAERLIAGLEGGRVGEVHLELARSALTRGVISDAERHLDQVPVGGEHDTMVGSLRRAVRSRRAELSRPMEAELGSLVAAGRWAEAEALARNLTSLNPESEAARRVLRECSRRRAEAEAQRFLHDAEQSILYGEMEHALALLEEARRCGADTSELDRQVRHAIEDKRAREKQQRLDALVACLQGDMTPRLVAAYWEADADSRSAARARVVRQELGWLEEIGPVRGQAQIHEIASGLAALREAFALVSGGMLRQAESTLLPHAKVAQQVGEGRQLLDRLQTELEHLRREEVRALLGEVETLIERDFQKAGKLLERITPGALSPDLRETWTRLHEKLRVAKESQGLAAALAACTKKGDWLGARDQIERLVLLAESSTKEAWLAEREVILERIRTQWVRETFAGPSVAASLQDIEPYDTGWYPPIWLLPGQPRLVLGAAHSDQIFVRVLDLEDREKAWAVSLRTPVPLGHLDLQIEGGSAWLFGGSGWVLEVGIDPFEIRRWRSVEEAGVPAGLQEDCFIVPGSPYMWVIRQGDDNIHRAFVVDTRRWSVVRELGECFAPCIACGSLPPRVVSSRRDKGIEILDERGATVWEDLKTPDRFEEATLHPTGDGFLVLVARSETGNRWDPDCLVVRELSAERGWGSELVLRDAYPDALHQLGTSRERASTFVVYDSDSSGRTLLEVGARSGGIQELSRTTIPGGVSLVQDPAGQHLRALAGIGPDVRSARLGNVGILSSAGPRASLSTVSVFGATFCQYPEGELREQILAYQSRLAGLDLDAAVREIRRLMQEAREDADTLVALHLAISHYPRLPIREELTRLVRQNLWNHPLMRLKEAEEGMEAGEWNQALGLLEGIDTSALDEASLQHTFHLRGMCRLGQGDDERAHEEFCRALAVVGGRCALGEALELTSHLCGKETGPRGDLAESTTGLVIAAVRAADRDLEQGDTAAVIGRLDRREVWQCRSVHVHGRLVEAYLRAERPGATFRFRKRLALSSFVKLLEDKLARESLLGSLAWPENRLRDLFERSRAWLADH